MKLKEITYIFAAIIITFVIGLGFNIYYQVDKYREKLIPKTQINAFISKTDVKSYKLIGEKILSIKSVKSIYYRSQENILKEVKENNPRINEIMVTGNNPFSPYFVVKTKDINTEIYKAVISKINKIKSIDDVTYDENIVKIIEKLGNIISFHNFVIRIVLFLCAVLITVKFLWLWLHKEITVKRMIYLIITGVFSGAVGAGAYYMASNSIFKYAVIQLPASYIMCFILAGLLSTLIWEK